MVYRIFPALALLLALTACKTLGSLGSIDPFDTGSRPDVTTARLDLTAPGARPVSVAVIDRRPYVLGGSESPRFLGTERGRWGTPTDVSTASGRGLTEELTDVIAREYRRAGTPAQPLAVPPKAAEADAMALFPAQGTDRLLLVKILEWRADSLTRMELAWAFEASVRDPSGTALGQNASNGKSAVRGTTESKGGRAVMLQEMSQRLADLLNDPAVTRALR